MENVYPVKVILKKKNRKLFKACDRNDPVDDWECERAKRIESLKGNRNNFCLKEMLI